MAQNIHRSPLSYRGISLAPAMNKLYCSILNRRLSFWSEQHDKVVNKQNGFRKDRHTIDHILPLTNITDTRKKLKWSTFCAFIDFKKAYDTINRTFMEQVSLYWNLRENVSSNKVAICISEVVCKN